MYVNPFLRFFDRFYGKLIRASSCLQSIFLLILRLIWGHLFFLNGYEKFQNMQRTVEIFQETGISHFIYHAYAAAIIELIGGICLVIGFGSRLAALACSFLMIGIISTAHRHIFSWNLFQEPATLFQQLPFTFLIASLTIFIFGPGRISLDGWIKRISARWEKY